MTLPSKRQLFDRWAPLYDLLFPYAAPEQVFAEIYRVLCPGGRFYLVAPAARVSMETLKIPVSPGGLSSMVRRCEHTWALGWGFDVCNLNIFWDLI